MFWYCRSPPLKRKGDNQIIDAITTSISVDAFRVLQKSKSKGEQNLLGCTTAEDRFLHFSLMQIVLFLRELNSFKFHGVVPLRACLP